MIRPSPGSLHQGWFYYGEPERTLSGFKEDFLAPWPTSLFQSLPRFSPWRVGRDSFSGSRKGDPPPAPGSDPPPRGEGWQGEEQMVMFIAMTLVLDEYS
jgi:hypothetical protein